VLRQVEISEALLCDDAGTRYLAHWGGPPFRLQPHL
jgi:hypothetical protein